MITDLAEKEVHAQSFFVPPAIGNLLRADELFREKFGVSARLATLPDIIDARLASFFDSPAWKLPYITTATAVYIGTVKQSLPLVVIAHGIGPMATLEGAHEFSRNSVDITLERHKMFTRLVRGDYGIVSIFNLADVVGTLEQVQGLLTYADAIKHPIVQTLIGARIEEYARALAQSDTIHKEELSERHVIISRFGFEQFDLLEELEYGPVGFFVHADVTGRHSCGSCTSYCSKFTICPLNTAVRFVAVQGNGALTGISLGPGEMAI